MIAMKPAYINPKDKEQIKCYERFFMLLEIFHPDLTIIFYS